MMSERQRRPVWIALFGVLLLGLSVIGFLAMQKAKMYHAAAYIENRGGFVSRSPCPDWMKTNIPHEWHSALLTPVSVDIYDTAMDDRLLASIGSLSQLEDLSFDGSDINDNDLAVLLLRLPKLEELSLINTRITDRSLEILGQMQRLEHLHLKGTVISEDGIKELKRRLPGCEVYP